MDEEFMRMREEANKYFLDRITNAFNKAIGCRFPAMTFLFDFEWPSIDKPGIITIYTTRPGILIGVHGTNIDELRNKLKEEFQHDFEIHIKEVRYMYTSTFVGKVES